MVTGLEAVPYAIGEIDYKTWKENMCKGEGRIKAG